MGFFLNLFKTRFEKPEIEELLRSVSLFKDLSKKELSYIFSVIHTRIYSAGEQIYKQGDPGIAIYIIQNGEVELRREAGSGHEPGKTYSSKGDIFGETAILEDGIRAFSAIAVKESKIAVIFRNDIDDFMNLYPKRGLIILRGLLKMISSLIRSSEVK